MVALDTMPTSCAARCTSSHVWPLILRSQIRSRTRPLKTSAPPPGSEPRPASLSCCSTSGTVWSLMRAKWLISLAVNAWMCTSGASSRSARIMSR